jgi:glutathione peroxidase
MFPSSDFGDPMEEKTNSELFCWCKFDGISDFAEIFSFVNVKGPKMSPLFKHFTQQIPPTINGNFTKFLVDKNCNISKRFEPSASFENIENEIRKLL